jgi:hypothetical protein
MRFMNMRLAESDFDLASFQTSHWREIRMYRPSVLWSNLPTALIFWGGGAAGATEERCDQSINSPSERVSRALLPSRDSLFLNRKLVGPLWPLTLHYKGLTDWPIVAYSGGIRFTDHHQSTMAEIQLTPCRAHGASVNFSADLVYLHTLSLRIQPCPQWTHDTYVAPEVTVLNVPLFPREVPTLAKYLNKPSQPVITIHTTSTSFNKRFHLLNKQTQKCNPSSLKSQSLSPTITTVRSLPDRTNK